MPIHTPPTVIADLDFSANTPTIGDTTDFPTDIEAILNRLVAENSNNQAFQQQVINALSSISDYAENNADENATNSASIGKNADEITALKSALLRSQNQQYNALRDHGSFIIGTQDPADGGITANDGTFSMRCLDGVFTGVNGCDFNAGVELARHYYQSSAYGGTAPATDTIAQNLNAIMGGSLPLRDPAYAIAQVSSGTGETLEGPTGYFRFFNVALMWERLTVNRHGSFALWMKCSTGDWNVEGFADGAIQSTYLNGVKLTPSTANNSPYQTIAANVWTHVAYQWETDTQSRNNYPPIYVPPSTNIQIALPVVFPGAFQILPHKGLIRSYPTT